VDLVPRGYRFLPTAEELVVDYLANWVAGALLPSRAVAFADVYGTEPWNLLGSGRQEAYFFAERKPKSSGGSRVDRKAGADSWTLNKKQEAVRSMVGGREMVVGRKSYLSFNDGRRKNSGWSMYDYEMISSGFQRRVLCHVKNSHPAISGGGTTIETVDSSTFREAVISVTKAISGGSFVGQKRNREESSTLSAVSVTLSKKPCWGSSAAHSSGALQSDVSPPPTAVVQQPVSAPVVTPPECHLLAPVVTPCSESRPSSIDSVASNEAGIVGVPPSSTDVGGGELVMTAEGIDAFLGWCERL
ncbi:No apical meristem (NAM) protein, partial [Musa troglodytarum]